MSICGSPRGAEFYELQARNFLGDMGQSFDALYVDNRTGGFLTHVFWKGSGGRIVETYIGYLRRKTEGDGASRLIHTVRGVGYMLVRETPPN